MPALWFPPAAVTGKLLLLPLRLSAFAASVLCGALALLVLLSIPPEEVTLRLNGPRQPIAILWDGYGVPTIRAADAQDAWFALGFVHARDRLWQMELRRRAARGQLAAILGPDALPMDRLVRTLALGRRADASLAHFEPADRALLEAYARGVDAYVRAAPLRPLPFLLLDLRPEPWRPSDGIAIQKLFALDLEDEWRQEMLRTRLLARLGPGRFADLFPDAAPDELATIAAGTRAALPEAAAVFARLETVLPADTGGGASNAWALAPGRTTDGVPLLANDPHLWLEWPTVWYLVRIETPELAVTGASVPGLPAVVIGHNQHLAWGLTTTHADTQDLIEVDIDPDGTSYRTHAGSEPFRLREEPIEIRGGGLERLRVRETRYGPLVSDLRPGASDDRRGYALAWPALAEDDTTLAFALQLASARTGAELAAAAPLFVAPAHNLLWADSSGSIGFRVLGRIPRRQGHDGFLPISAAAPSAAWAGFLAANEMPAVVDPPEGLLVNANNRPIDGAAGARLARSWPDDLRARRILELLHETAPSDAAAQAAIQLDIRSGLARAFLPHLRPISFADGRLARLRDALLAWDGRMRADRFEPALFAAWYEELGAALYADELGPLFAAFRGTHYRFVRRILEQRPIWCDDVGTPAREDCGQRIALAFERAVAALEALTGREVEQIRWGDWHQGEFAEPVFGKVPGLAGLFRLRVPLAGGRSTVNLAAWSSDAPFTVRHAPGLRMIVSLGRPPQSHWALATGQSGRPFSPHARDLLSKWQQGAYIRLGQCGPDGRLCRQMLLVPAGQSGSG